MDREFETWRSRVSDESDAAGTMIEMSDGLDEMMNVAEGEGSSKHEISVVAHFRSFLSQS